MRRFWLLAALLLPLGALARIDRTAEVYGYADGNRASFTFGSSATPSARAFKAAPGGAEVSGKAKLPWPGKQQAQHMANWKAMATPTGMAKSLMNPASAALTLLAFPLIKYALDQACVGVLGGVLKEGAVWQECDFINSEVDMWYVSGSPATKSSTQAGACNLYASQGVGFPWWATPPLTGAIDVNGLCVIRRAANGQYVDGRGFVYAGKETVPTSNGMKPATSPEALQRVEQNIAATVQQWCQADFTAGLGAGQGNCALLPMEMLTGGLGIQTQKPVPDMEAPVEAIPGTPAIVERTLPDGRKERVTTTETTTVTCVDNVCTRTVTTTTKTEQETTPGGPLETVKEDVVKTEDPRSACELDPKSAACADAKATEQATEAPPQKDPDKTAEDILKPLKDFAANPKSALPTFPTLNWAFQLPSGCTAISLPAFAPYLQSIDLCPWVSLFHDLMSIVWVMGGLFGAISMFWRNTLSQS